MAKIKAGNHKETVTYKWIELSDYATVKEFKAILKARGQSDSSFFYHLKRGAYQVNGQDAKMRNGWVWLIDKKAEKVELPKSENKGGRPKGARDSYVRTVKRWLKSTKKGKK